MLTTEQQLSLKFSLLSLIRSKQESIIKRFMDGIESKDLSDISVKDKINLTYTIDISELPKSWFS